MQIYSATDTGLVRVDNQDYVYATNSPVGALDNLLLLADGVGGEQGGGFASRYIVEDFIDDIDINSDLKPISALDHAFKTANEHLRGAAYAHPSYKRMASTLVAGTIVNRDLIIGNVGDSRCYIIEEDIRQITRDHTYTEELVRQGVLSQDQAENHEKKHSLTRAMGAQDRVRVDFFEVPLREGSVILLCSDGLTNMLNDEEILKIIKKAETLEEAGQELIDSAKMAGGYDNISVVMATIPDFKEET